MLTIIGSVLGFLSSIIPDIINLIRIYYSNKNASDIMDRKLEVFKIGGDPSKFNFDDSFNSNFIQNQYLNNPPPQERDGFSMSVRPVLAYGFFIIYVVVKFIQFNYIKEHIMINYSGDIRLSFEKIQIMLLVLWSEQDQIFLPMIVSSYFGQRMMQGYRIQGNRI